jgi:hypothetical protein
MPSGIPLALRACGRIVIHLFRLLGPVFIAMGVIGSVVELGTTRNDRRYY